LGEVNREKTRNGNLSLNLVTHAEERTVTGREGKKEDEQRPHRWEDYLGTFSKRYPEHASKWTPGPGEGRRCRIKKNVRDAQNGLDRRLNDMGQPEGVHSREK